jgi:hypothetical protein
MLDLMHVGKNLVGERLEEVAEDDLILGDPGVVRRVWLHLGSFVGGVLVRRDRDLLRGGGSSTREVAKEASAADSRKNLGAPAREIGAGELVGGRVPEGGRRRV